MPRTFVTRWLAGVAVLVCAASGASCAYGSDQMMYVPGSCDPSPCFQPTSVTW